MNNSCITNNQPLSLVYLDANATTAVLPQAAKAALTSMETIFGNPSSSHITGLQAKHIMNKARQQALRVTGAGSGNIIFTSGATEGIQTAILSALQNVKKTINNKKKIHTVIRCY
jgi:cysteine sulfinate desulfinase/cysteine desulfurase-like protein